MKKISVIIPCYNEENSIEELYNRILDIFQLSLPQYEFEIIFVDDYSRDTTRVKIRKI